MTVWPWESATIPEYKPLAEAHAELTRRAEAKLTEAIRALQAAQGFAGNVRGMKPPQELITTPEDPK